MRLRVATLVLLALACCGGTPAFAKHEISKQTRELFEWFDKLGFEDTGRAKFVRIRTGSGMVDGDEKIFDESDGFLIEDRGPVFRAVLGDLTVGTFTKAGTDRADPAYCGYRELSIEAQARTVLRELRTPAQNSGEYHQMFDRLSMAGQIFALARECERRGSGALAEQLVGALVNQRSDNDAKAKWSAFSDQLHEDFANAMLWRAMIAFRDPGRTWASLAEGYRRIVELCPGTNPAQEAGPIVEKIERLAEEEKAHAAVAPASLDGLPVAERARELVWRLRDEQDPSLDQADAWGRPWPQAIRQSNGAMDGLRQLGLDAVPALLAELRGEERLSRSIVRSTPDGSCTRPNSTTELANRILDEISGLDFRSLVRPVADKSERLQTADEAEDWYKTVRTRGEEAWLVETVRGGGMRAVNCAPRLMQMYPGSFTGAALSGLLVTLNSNDNAACDRLLALLAPHREPAVETVLLDQLKSTESYHDCLAIAFFLRRWGYSEADEIMRADWVKLVNELFTEDRGDGGRGSFQQQFPSPLGSDRPADDLRYLAMSDSPENLRLVLATWPKVPMTLRVPLVLSLGYGGIAPPFVADAPNSPVFRAFSQEVLLTALEDVTELPEFSVPSEEGAIFWPRLCDLAGAALHARRPDKYVFNARAPESVRERQRLVILNGRRREDGLAETLLPPARAQVSAGKLNHVYAVEWEDGSEAPSPELRRHLAEWCDHPFRPDTLTLVLTAYANAPQAGTNRLRMVIHRDGDGTGVFVRFRLAKGVQGEGFKQLILAGEQCLHSTASYGAGTPLGSKEFWAGFGNNATLALQRPPQVPVFIEVEMTLPNQK